VCSQCGLILGRRQRRTEERQVLKQVFTRLLLLGEPRGPHATGLAWVNRIGQHRIFKAPLPASLFVQEKAFQETLDGVDNRATILMGHNRWPTRGGVGISLNNHPIRCLDCLGTAQGTIVNADVLFHRLRLRRHAEVDSELIFRLAGRMTDKDGRIDPDRLITKLALFRGQMSAVIVSRRDPDTILILKGDKPLSLWLNRRYQAVAYASDETYLHKVLSDKKGWLPLDVPPMTLVVFSHEAIHDFHTKLFHFTIQPRRSIFHRGIST
jgi:amidophosphoribosyltransferase